MDDDMRTTQGQIEFMERIRKRPHHPSGVWAWGAGYTIAQLTALGFAKAGKTIAGCTRVALTRAGEARLRRMLVSGGGQA